MFGNFFEAKLMEWSGVLISVFEWTTHAIDFITHFFPKSIKILKRFSRTVWRGCCGLLPPTIFCCIFISESVQNRQFCWTFPGFHLLMGHKMRWTMWRFSLSIYFYDRGHWATTMYWLIESGEGQFSVIFSDQKYNKVKYYIQKKWSDLMKIQWLFTSAPSPAHDVGNNQDSRVVHFLQNWWFLP